MFSDYHPGTRAREDAGIAVPAFSRFSVHQLHPL
jgi:hypothetical protein